MFTLQSVSMAVQNLNGTTVREDCQGSKRGFYFTDSEHIREVSVVYSPSVTSQATLKSSAGSCYLIDVQGANNEFLIMYNTLFFCARSSACRVPLMTAQ